MKKVYLLLFLIMGLTAHSQFVTLTPQAKVSLLTVDSGNQLYSLYGHTGLRISDPGLSIDEVYNYGYFDFSTPNFYMKFVKGDLQYFAAKDQYIDFYQNYIYEQRAVYEQVLNLNQQQIQNIYNDLNTVLASDRRFYTYKFIDRNCTTMVADVINKHIASPISTDISVANQSYRKILYDYQQDRFFENFGINIMFGSKTDRIFDHNFLPMQLLEGVEKTVVNGQKLSDKTTVINSATLDPDIPFWNTQWTVILFLVILIVFSKRRMVQVSYYIVSGLLGLFLLLAGLYSLHEEVVSNINILLFNPLLLPLAVLALRRDQRYTRYLTLLSAGMLLTYIAFMLNKVHFSMFFPLMITTAIMLWRTYTDTKESPQHRS